MEPIVEQISQWIADWLNGTQDPGETLTLNVIRPVILNWEEQGLKHGDLIIELGKTTTQEKTTASSRKELASWKLYGVVTDLNSNAVDTVMSRMAETVRRRLWMGNKNGRACGGLAFNIDCPEVEYAFAKGCRIVIVTVNVTYPTDMTDSYE